MSELKSIIDTYRLNQQKCSIHFHREDNITKESLEHIVKFIPLLKEFDKPDMYAKKGNEVLLLEHFQFDSANHLRKGGSLQKHEEARLEEKFQQAVSNSTDGTITTHDLISAKPCLENYKSNFKRNFATHYNKISEYIKNLKNVGIIDSATTCKTAFFIEDTSALGNFFLNRDGQPNFLTVLYTNFFWEFIKDYKEHLDFIFFGVYNGEKDIIYFVDLNSRYDYSKCAIELTESNYFSFEPNVISVSIAIPREEVEKMNE